MVRRAAKKNERKNNSHKHAISCPQPERYQQQLFVPIHFGSIVKIECAVFSSPHLDEQCLIAASALLLWQFLNIKLTEFLLKCSSCLVIDTHASSFVMVWCAFFLVKFSHCKLHICVQKEIIALWATPQQRTATEQCMLLHLICCDYPGFFGAKLLWLLTVNVMIINVDLSLNYKCL